MDNLRLALIDDEPDALIALQKHIVRAQCYDLTISTTDPEEGLKRLENGEADVLITDILMDKIDGILLASLVEKLNIPVILCSVDTGFGYEGYKVNAVHYLRKPVEYPDFLIAMSKIPGRTHISNPTPQNNPLEGMLSIFEHSTSSWTMVCISDILYIKQDKNYAEIFTHGNKYLVLTSLKALLDRLPQNQFLQIFRSILVNIQMIKSVKSDLVILKSGEKLTLGRVYENKLQEMFKKVSL